MSKLTKLFSSVPVEQQKASTFDMTHYSVGSGTCGTLIPVLKQDIIPGDLVSLGIMSQIDLPPMATAFMGRIDMRYEAFFVPNRIVWGGWEAFKTRDTDDPYAMDLVNSRVLPYIKKGTNASDADIVALIGRSSLADYLGYRFDAPTTDSTYNYVTHVNKLGDGDVIVDNALPFLAYHKIFDDWYRNSQVMQPLFVRPTSSVAKGQPLYAFPWLNFSDESGKRPTILIGGDLGVSIFYNGDNIFSLHQRCFGDDRFTTLALFPQAALNPQEIDSGDLTIPSIRAANILQRYKEVMNLAGERYVDQLFAEYGVRPADAILDRPLYLGSFSHGVYTSSIFQNTATSEGNEKNPFSNALGSSAGDTSGFGKDSLINGFKATEHGYIIVLASLVPHSFYSNGIDGDLRQQEVADIASPKLQGLGEQAVPTSEIMGAIKTIKSGQGDQSEDFPFGYSPQYSRYKYRNDEVHGELRATPHMSNSGSLRYFVLQRTIANISQSLDSSFLEIPTSFLDQVFSVTTAASGYSFMWFIQWQLRMTRPLAEYSIPTLGDPKDTYTTRMPLRGTQIKG